MRQRTIVIALLFSFGALATASTIVAIFYNLGSAHLYPTVNGGAASYGGVEGLSTAYHFHLLSIPISIVSWIGFGVTLAFWRGNYGRSIWGKAGLDKNVYNLMVTMRGGNSRLELLRNLESPKQRNELSQLTGIDWKEVDRQIGLLLSYGLVSVHAESGSVKIYKLTEQGGLLLKLMDELNRK